MIRPRPRRESTKVVAFVAVQSVSIKAKHRVGVFWDRVYAYAEYKTRAVCMHCEGCITRAAGRVCIHIITRKCAESVFRNRS